ncbi:hypothetical protein WH47_00339 [Habropoda laboriosa]|uniref:Uncharacterized protein n=1 Tax=Habropoda laboriosa TaxID=597456 RepID=A0A0L7R238_9HYME|nr:hypothetical protein WH47_00339 [Habropoda laboriosa]
MLKNKYNFSSQRQPKLKNSEIPEHQNTQSISKLEQRKTAKVEELRNTRTPKYSIDIKIRTAKGEYPKRQNSKMLKNKYNFSSQRQPKLKNSEIPEHQNTQSISKLEQRKTAKVEELRNTRTPKYSIDIKIRTAKGEYPKRPVKQEVIGVEDSRLTPDEFRHGRHYVTIISEWPCVPAHRRCSSTNCDACTRGIRGQRYVCNGKVRYTKGQQHVRYKHDQKLLHRALGFTSPPTTARTPPRKDVHIEPRNISELARRKSIAYYPVAHTDAMLYFTTAHGVS